MYLVCVIFSMHSVKSKHFVGFMEEWAIDTFCNSLLNR